MNKIVLNSKANNYIKVYPLKESGLEPPVDEKEQIDFARNIFDKLKNAYEAKKRYFYSNRAKGVQISVWVYDKHTYLVQCIRNEYKTYNTTIYINNDSEESINDLISCAKFLRTNYAGITKQFTEIIKHSTQQTDRPTDNAPTPDIPLVV